ncbi:hypothetical protein J4219_02045 [Candidatus Woesearchaeota archaeon]|nr:hypothetical protein [Candidatus Woesearchaeota archaeon]
MTNESDKDTHKKFDELNVSFNELKDKYDAVMELIALVYKKVKVMKDGGEFYLAKTVPTLYGANSLDDPKVPKYVLNLARALGDMEKTLDIANSTQISGSLTVDHLRQLEEAVENDGKIKKGKHLAEYSPHSALCHIWREYLVKKEASDSILHTNADEKKVYEERLKEKDRQIDAEKDKREQAETNRNDLRESLDAIIARLEAELGEDA